MSSSTQKKTRVTPLEDEIDLGTKHASNNNIQDNLPNGVIEKKNEFNFQKNILIIYFQKRKLPVT